jgi:hypothetical protein
MAGSLSSPYSYNSSASSFVYGGGGGYGAGSAKGSSEYNSLSSSQNLAYERHRFLDKFAEEIANVKLSFKSVASTTTSSTIWTYRNTCCDVISIITTVVPIKNGLMRDIKQANLEPR